MSCLGIFGDRGRCIRTAIVRIDSLIIQCICTYFESWKFLPRPPPTPCYLAHCSRRLYYFFLSLPHTLNHRSPRLFRFFCILPHLADYLVHHIASLLFLPFQRYSQLFLQLGYLGQFCVLFLHGFKFQPSVVGDLVSEESNEEGLEDRVGEGFVVCTLTLLC
jgi:hypothetical protein